MTKRTTQQFVDAFAADAAARPTQCDDADRHCSFLRGYAQTINDHTFEEIAAYIDELFGELWQANEELSGYREADVPDLTDEQFEAIRVKNLQQAALAKYWFNKGLRHKNVAETCKANGERP